MAMQLWTRIPIARVQFLAITGRGGNCEITQQNGRPKNTKLLILCDWGIFLPEYQYSRIEITIFKDS